MQILIVEDEPTITLVLAEAFQEQRFHVITADNGFSGWEWLDKGFSPDAVLVDLIMPRMGGRALIEKIRADPRFQHLPVVVITGEVADAVAFPEPSTYQALFTKPFDLDLLLAAVFQLVRQRHSTGTGFLGLPPL
ncbi:MAG: response regulator [Thermaerobacterales bacterium]